MKRDFCFKENVWNVVTTSRIFRKRMICAKILIPDEFSVEPCYLSPSFYFKEVNFFIFPPIRKMNRNFTVHPESNKRIDMKTKRIFLTGFMGAGKSTIGLILANTLGWTFYDLDAEIVKSSGKSVVAIFKDEGESRFREMEASVLAELSKNDNIIVALGGGAVLFEGVAKIIKDAGVSVYLKASPERIYDRLKYKTDRPLFQTLEGGALSKEEAMKKIRTMLKEREGKYMQADLVFNTEGLAVGKIVDQLKMELGRKF